MERNNGTKMIKIVIFFIVFLWVGLFSLNAEENLIATTSEGKKVILNTDGTWSYINETEQKITIVDFDIILRDKNYDESRYNKDAILNLKVKNISGNKIGGYRITVKMENGFGDLLHTLKLTSGNSVLDNDEIDNANFVFKDNQFIDDEVYDDLSAYSKNNLIITIVDSQVLQSQ
ncbi:hypothetical protein EXM22_01890 [Oceanispirochaeta crateris]|uniref:DUF3157 family protein n=1 Tax=Oceanispirochaeta crateris TaxID=2518645 RepID=A0A5C1QGX0_9SPIO|nr:hypothetical protein [Oceanispirochaeta crateris]QEN06801.1 hypothetical protein EXM22_01890 [Oceanispirochaeta crateris]